MNKNYLAVESLDGSVNGFDILAPRRDENGKLMSTNVQEYHPSPQYQKELQEREASALERFHRVGQLIDLNPHTTNPIAPIPALQFSHAVDLSTSAKRKSDLFEVDNGSEDEDSYFPGDQCDAVRRKLRNFMETGEMTQTKLCQELGVSAKSYRTFMAMNGKHNGTNTATYGPAYQFFQKREKSLPPAPRKKVKKADEEAENSVAVRLEGEDTISVPVFDSCDEVRRKIEAHLKSPNVTNAGFRREIAKTYPEAKDIQSKVLNDFLNKSGASAGNTSSVFYASYVYFEKMRLRDGKVKSKHRIEMEKAHPKGFDTKRRKDGRYITCMQGEKIRVVEDKFGVSRIIRY